MTTNNFENIINNDLYYNFGLVWFFLLKLVVKDRIHGAFFPLSVISLLIIWALANSL